MKPIRLLAAPALVAGAALLGACQTGPADSTSAGVGVEASRNLANNCFTCHGPGGRSPGTIPSIAHLSAADIATKLKSFKNGTAPSTVMGRHAKGYSDAEIDAVARYIAEKK